MATRCPHCRPKLVWWNIKADFFCPSCQLQLTAKVTGVWLATILLWSIVEILLYLATAQFAHTNLAAFIIVRSLLSIGIGYIIGGFIFGVFCVVEQKVANE